MMLHLTDVEIRDREPVELWRVFGRPGILYPTKVAAEVAARTYFPNEDVVTRDARVSFKRFYSAENFE